MTYSTAIIGFPIIEELFKKQTSEPRYLGTLGALLPALSVYQSFPGPDGSMQPVWKAIWPLLGATNQLLAGLCIAYFGCFPAGSWEGLWVCSLACSFNDFYAHACSCMDGSVQWF